MTTRLYECEQCGTRKSKEVPMGENSPKAFCKLCKKRMDQVFGFQTAANCGVFESYIEKNIDAKPIEITTAAQRDRLCEERGVTYDTYSNLHRIRNKKTSAADSVSFDEVMTQNKKDNGEWL